MTSPDHNPSPSPNGSLLSLHGPEFAADPEGVYRRLRAYGPIAPVELSPGVPGMLVTDYQVALEILRDQVRFPRDARRWQQGIPSDCPVLPIMAYRPTCNLTDDPLRSRLREAVTDTLDRVDHNALRTFVERSANRLVGRMSPLGEVDLRTEYALVLPLLVFNELCGCPAELGERMVAAVREVLKWENSEEANMTLGFAVLELMALKRENPGPDLTTWLMDHPAELTDEEVAHQIVMLVGAGSELAQNLIVNTLRLLLSDERFRGGLSGGSLSVEDALDEVLWTDPPLANFGISYPVEPLDFHGVRLPADQPVVISFAAANNDPATRAEDRAGNRAHLSWGIGPHACPAQGQARVIATVAIERLLDGLPDMELAVPAEELTWRPGFIQRALSSLPVRFPPAPGPPQPLPGDPYPPAGPGAVAEPPAGPAAEEAPMPRPPARWWRRLANWWAGDTA
ncbi:cytochrome P450 [Actinoallomurus iriomotensis]|uniref:Cytochrome P450 n=1 Tax=Actinoallomurus iriomotensis TaxID=478107 RepID=A0A9W6W3R8_9ACTN|nr:cytochrome P450 [Actinoallomurus iriomotensis]GLY90275.1 cytochrome P450 [Actinoallomurus iriomotensis]